MDTLPNREGVALELNIVRISRALTGRCGKWWRNIKNEQGKIYIEGCDRDKC